MPAIFRFSQPLVQLLPIRVDVRRTLISDARSFKVDLPSGSPGIGFLEFFDLNKLIRLDVLEQLSCSAGGPCHFDGTDPGGLADAYMLHQR